MPKLTRVFEREVTIKSQGQYAQPKGEGSTLRLLRWRLTVDGVDGSWRRADAKSGNGGWPNTLKESDIQKD